jgi:hypothetical protein
MVTFKFHVKVPFIMSLNPSNVLNPSYVHMHMDNLSQVVVILLYNRHNMGVMLGWLISSPPARMVPETLFLYPLFNCDSNLWFTSHGNARPLC